MPLFNSLKLMCHANFSEKAKRFLVEKIYFSLKQNFLTFHFSAWNLVLGGK